MSALADLLAGRSVVALTGAGISTESGIPDYRGEGTRARARKPIQHAEFIADPDVRQRYWARSYLGWPTIAGAEPNDGHRALVRLERAGVLRGVITQNVDRLHRAAGSERVVELHGALADVACLGCDAKATRDQVQRRLASLNADFTAGGTAPRPDGDRQIDDDAVGRFVVAPCLSCGGPLKPDVVFFGGSVPRAITDRAWALYAEADVLLVIGSSLAVYSGFRFVRQASKDSMPVAIINRGETRGDPLAAMCVDAPAGDTLAALARELC